MPREISVQTEKRRVSKLLALHAIESKGKTAPLQGTNVLVRDLFAAMDEMLANRDHYTFEHAIRVAEISKRVGEALHLSPREIEILELGCLVHDIGKVAIPDDVLLKPGRFDREDRRIMELHPLIGANLFNTRLYDEALLQIILSHHERLDGSGYPNKLQGEQINLQVRIVAVADVYEALIATRPYKLPMPRERALRILQEEVDTDRLDARVLDALRGVTEGWDPLEIVREFTASYSIELEDFRKKIYFKEPLSDFYNYRYLLALDGKRVLGQEGDSYRIIMIDFRELRSFNRKHGYVKADEFINETGGRLYSSVKTLLESSKAAPDSILMVKKGADYLIYTCCPEHLFERLLENLQHHLQQAERDWGLLARMITRCHPKGYSIEKALNELFIDG